MAVVHRICRVADRCRQLESPSPAAEIGFPRTAQIATRGSHKIGRAIDD